MKNLLILILILTYWTCNLGYSQSINNNYKTFSDTAFEVGDKILASEIYFTLSGGSRVISAHYDSVQVIADFLKLHPNMVIELGVHTDSRGNPNASIKLSEFRANSVKDELVNRFGIKSERVRTKGYGKSQLLLDDEHILQAVSKEDKEKLHSKNRRVEVKIIAN